MGFFCHSNWLRSDLFQQLLAVLRCNTVTVLLSARNFMFVFLKIRLLPTSFGSSCQGLQVENRCSVVLPILCAPCTHTLSFILFLSVSELWFIIPTSGHFPKSLRKTCYCESDFIPAFFICRKKFLLDNPFHHASPQSNVSVFRVAQYFAFDVVTAILAARPFSFIILLN